MLLTAKKSQRRALSGVSGLSCRALQTPHADRGLVPSHLLMHGSSGHQQLFHRLLSTATWSQCCHLVSAFAMGTMATPPHTLCTMARDESAGWTGWMESQLATTWNCSGRTNGAPTQKRQTLVLHNLLTLDVLSISNRQNLRCKMFVINILVCKTFTFWPVGQLRWHKMTF